MHCAGQPAGIGGVSSFSVNGSLLGKGIGAFSRLQHPSVR